jgi:tetratricopeptide (TPR) repeat protein
MPDWGILSLPIFGATGVMLLAFLTSDDIAIDKIRVPPPLEWNGYSDVVITEMLTDHLREINQSAVELEVGIEVDASRYDASISQFEEYFGLTEVVTGMRELTGAIRYYVSGDIADENGKLIFTARVFVEEGSTSAQVVKAEGDLANLNGVLEEGALRILEIIDPYIVAVHYHEEELKAGQYRFERTLEKLEKYVLNPPPDNNYLAFDLIGRMHLERAKCDATLTTNDRAAERERALTWLRYAIESAPDYLLTNLHLAEAYIQLQQYEVADQYFARAVQIEPNNWVVRERWGSALAEQGRVRHAIFQYVAAVELNQGNAQLRNTLSKLYMKANYPEAARVQLEKALLIHPDTVYPDLNPITPQTDPIPPCEL